MSEKMFCYCCRVHHQKDQMRPVQTRSGTRWRCLRTITATRCSRAERDAFGKQKTAENREIAKRQAEHTYRLRALMES